MGILQKFLSFHEGGICPEITGQFKRNNVRFPFFLCPLWFFSHEKWKSVIRWLEEAAGWPLTGPWITEVFTGNLPMRALIQQVICRDSRWDESEQTTLFRRKPKTTLKALTKRQEDSRANRQSPSVCSAISFGKSQQSLWEEFWSETVDVSV